MFSVFQRNSLYELLVSFEVGDLGLSVLQKLWVCLHLLELGVRWSCESVQLVEGLLLQSSLSEGCDIVRFCVKVLEVALDFLSTALIEGHQILVWVLGAQVVHYLQAVGEGQVAVLERRHGHLWVNLGVPLIVVVHLDVNVHWHLVEVEAQFAQGCLDNLGVDAGVGPVAVNFRTGSSSEACSSEVRSSTVSGLLYDSAQHRVTFLVVLELKFKLLIEDHRRHGFK